jgi:DNA-binding LacI/PurR family transcriptional regulator
MKYIALYNSIKTAIKNGEFDGSNKLPEMQELVQRYSVSITTVFRAVQLLKKEGIIHAVRGKGLFIVSSPNTGNIPYNEWPRVVIMFPGYLFNTMKSEAFRKILRAVEITCEQNKFELILLPQRDKSDFLSMKTIEAERVSGVILFDINHSELLNDLKNKKIPTVVCFAWNPSVNIDQVGLDHFAISADIYKKCIGLKKSKIIFIGSKKRANTDEVILSHYSWEIALKSQSAFTEQIGFDSYYAEIRVADTQRGEIRELLRKQGNQALFVVATHRPYNLLIEQAAEIEANYTSELSVVLLHSWIHQRPELHGRVFLPYSLVWDSFAMGEQAVNILKQRLEHVAMKTQRVLFGATISPVDSFVYEKQR